MLLGERRSRTWESRGGVQLGPGEAVCGQAGHEATEGSPCPPPPARSRPTCGRLSSSAAFPARGSPWAGPGAADKLEQGLCSVFTSRRLLKDALRGSQKVPAWVSPGAGREKANPAPCRQLCCGWQHRPPCEETANSGHVAPHRPLKARG